jgi:guanine nucleotide-binding protein subunit alpha
VLLWKSIVQNPLLKATNLVLFLNKCDILKAKLASGIKLSEYIVSYGSRPNDFESASHCERCFHFSNLGLVLSQVIQISRKNSLAS